MNVTASYQFSRDDYRAIVRASYSQTRAGRFMLWAPVLAWVALLAMGVLIAIELSQLEDISIYDVLAVIPGHSVFIILAGILTIPIDRIIAWFTFSKLSFANKTVTFHFENDGYESRVGGNGSRFTWPSIRRFMETKDNLFIFLSQVEGQIVPRRAVASDQEFVELAAAIHAKIADSNNSSLQ